MLYRMFSSFLTRWIVILLAAFSFPSVLNSQTWAPIGFGFNNFVTCVTVYNGNLVAGGFFTSSGFTTLNRIAQWNGTSWSPIGSGANDFVQCVQIYNGFLHIGGNFTTPYPYIAVWNGSWWSDLGGSTHAGVYDMDVYAGYLIACGNFEFMGGLTVNYIARWNGWGWSAMAGGMNQPGVYALAVYNNELVAAGNFASAGGVSASNIAKWNGSSWSPLGSGVNNYVLALGVYNGELYAGGDFSVAGGVSALRVARWNGSSWAPLGSGTNGIPLVFYVYNGELIVGGTFSTAGGIGVNYIARWNGGNWLALPNGGMNWWVRALGVYGTYFIAGGSFTNAGGVNALFIARTDNPLPVVLASFKSSVIKNDVILDWVTAEELNNQGFDIERKIVDGSWIKVGYVQGYGTTNEPKSYRFIDRYLQKGKYRYRLKQIDYNGNSEFHELSDDVDIGVPAKFSVFQNYPNPSNPGSRIDYQLPYNSRVTIQFYDAAGRELPILLDEVKEAGYYTFEFDGRGFASGVYFYKLTAGPYSRTMKMLLLK